jgi:hypothetical protein
MTYSSVFLVEQQDSLSREQIESLRGAADAATAWVVAPRPSGDGAFFGRVRDAENALRQLEKFLAAPPAPYVREDPGMTACRAAMRDLRANIRLLRAAVATVSERPRYIPKLPRVLHAERPDEPRVAAAAGAYLHAVDYEFSISSFQAFIQTLQAHEPLAVDELWSLAAFLSFVLLESLIEEARTLRRAPESVSAHPFSIRIKSLRSIADAGWVALIEPLICFDALLNQDPAGVYPRMDFESRQMYRKRIALIASRSDCTELQVAQAALDLARVGSEHPGANPRMQVRLMHVGYYLIDKGFSQLAFRIGFHPQVSWRVRRWILDNAEDFYITGIQLFTIFAIAAALFPVSPQIASFSSLAFAVAVLLLPATQIAVDLVNNSVTSFFDPVLLPKLDFSEGIPPDCATLVAVPTLLLNEKQVRDLVNDLEVRYLANRGPNLHFALLTDLADSVSKPRENDAHPLVELAIRLIDELNARYGAGNSGGFMLLHRQRIFNTRQGVWMGWERKRGKLLDLNMLLAGEQDAFPIKVGNLEALGRVRYILTLDSDSQLPRGAAARLTGAIAHPLNQAIIDPKLRIVTEGYGILQPRIGITVRSTARSRLGAIYSGQSGFDIYTRAISDAYQDLFGEGIFTGKGIYEVETLHAVLNHRFPRNALLSHDLIEGAYARAGLVTDTELVDDYPSHYNAYMRRQHRWVRGDWQIAPWIFSHVRDESGRRVKNPISPIARWKILDNMRRSLVDPCLLILFVAGWLGLPGGPLYWTIVPLLMLLFPLLAQLGFGLLRAFLSRQKGRHAEAFAAFRHAALIALLHLVLLVHQTFLTIDAVVRSLIRWFITGERLLEWESAAQAELNTARRSGLDRYLAVAPFLAVALGLAVWLFAARRTAIYCAAPILLLWAIAGPVTGWLNRPPRKRRIVKQIEQEFLYIQALRIWRYFHEFGGERHNYLIPDNVEEQGSYEAARVSPTNIGLLLNARQAACEFGFLTAPEFAAITGRSLATIARLEKFRGHLYNWYDTQTLHPLDGASFISTVDSGNMVASLYTLRTGTRRLAQQPLLRHALFTGMRAHWRLMRKEAGLPARIAKYSLPEAKASASTWIAWLPAAQIALSEACAVQSGDAHRAWWLTETLRRVDAMLALLRGYLPWTLPEYEPLRALSLLGEDDKAIALSIDEALLYAEALDARLERSQAGLAGQPSIATLAEQLRGALSAAMKNLRTLAASLHGITQQAGRLAEETDFSFLIDPTRRILSIGYDAGTQTRHVACYDMLASEARIATFFAIARGDIPLQSWLKLSRGHMRAYGRFVLLSWTGTMFEYLMPSLWMRSYPGTLIARTLDASVSVQQEFGRALKLPWGISESGNAGKDSAGHYLYHAYGVPRLALSVDAVAGPVISPYSTFLALGIDTTGALANLHRMAAAGWIGAYGYYEAADYTSSLRKPVLVREWMAHHQGMSLLAILNVLHENVVQRWFHENPVVQSTERLLHEVPVSKAVLRAQRERLAPIRVH